MKPFIKYNLIALGIVLVDQLIKVLVKFNMRLHESFSVLGDFLKIYFIENEGAAFGVTLRNLAPGLSDAVAKVILTVFSVAAVGVIYYLLRRTSNERTRLPLFIALILGGAVGNILDRVFYGVWFASMNDYEGGLFFGQVVDMFYVDIWQGFLPESWPLVGGMHVFLWPVFNLADSAISVGIVAIIVFQKKLFATEMFQKHAAADTTPALTSADESE